MGNMEKKALENHVEKKVLTEKEMAALKIKAKEEEKAFNERMLLAIEKEEKLLPEKVEQRKKKALELATVFEENAVKAKKELSAAEKQQLREKIEMNSKKYAEEMQEELMEAKVLQKTALGHALNPAEKTLIEKLELQVNERIEKSSKTMEAQLVAQKRKAFEIVEIMEQNAAKSKKPLSETQKKEVMEGIEANSARAMKDMQEDLLEEKAMAKKAFGHKLNAAEEKHVANYAVTFENQMALNQMVSAFGM